MSLVVVSPSGPSPEGVLDAPLLLEDLPAFRRRKVVPPEVSPSGDHGPAPVGRVIGHLVLASLAVVTVFPIVWMYLGSLRPPGDLFSSGLIATTFSLGNYATAIRAVPMATLLLHTVLVAVAVTCGQLLTALLAAYSLARFHFKGRELLFFVFIGSWLIPFQVTMLPNYVLLSHLGLLNSLAGIIVPQLTSALGILLLRQHLRGFPTDLFDAARAEGQSAFATLWFVVVPNLAPVLVALAILLFVSSWNEYFWPLLVYRNPDSVVQLGIQNYLQATTVDYGALMAMSGLATLPIFAIYALLQRRVVSAFVRSGLR